MTPPDLSAAAALLEVDPDAPEDQIRKQHRLLIHLFAPDSPVVYGLYTRDEARRLVERLDAACATLTTAARRPPTDRARRPDSPAPSLPPAPAPAADRIRDPLAALGLPPDTPLRGEIIHRVRHLLGLHLEEIADRTKIGVFTLRCIETETWPDLPAKVYLKGFLRQIAPLLRLDPERLTRDYLAAFDAWEHDNRRKKRW
ncbi:MAG: helix-turn-helix domain-containing protein [Myxococcales bacterium]|nr:helix-turn-helix domain-containing protein [Myxococcales bacterium]